MLEFREVFRLLFMRLHHRMTSKLKSPTRSHKGYHNVPVFHSTATSRLRTQTNPSSSPSLEIVTDAAYSQHGPSDSTQKLVSCPCIIIGIVLFFVFLIAIFNNMPSPGSALPSEDIAIHEIHFSLNQIIAPRFTVDRSISDRIPQMNAIQLMEQMDAISVAKGGNLKRAIVYVLPSGASKDEVCVLLLSLTSAVRSTASFSVQTDSLESAPSSDIDFVLFYDPNSFPFQSLDFKAMAHKLG